MAFLHCHTHNCNWSQDDFYTLHYNPLTKIWSNIKWLIKPRFIEIDGVVLTDSLFFTHFPVSLFRAKSQMQVRVFSWNWLLLEIVKDLKNAKIMKWWTYNSWEKDYVSKKAVCPKCKQINFDVD
jgi:hypothetical protein